MHSASQPRTAWDVTAARSSSTRSHSFPLRPSMACPPCCFTFEPFMLWLPMVAPIDAASVVITSLSARSYLWWHINTSKCCQQTSLGVSCVAGDTRERAWCSRTGSRHTHRLDDCNIVDQSMYIKFPCAPRSRMTRLCTVAEIATSLRHVNARDTHDFQGRCSGIKNSHAAWSMSEHSDDITMECLAVSCAA